ncbi:hypothetical protein MNBD_BACTEROID06-1010, partial [hydrothermal vent metagenome]
MVQKPLVTIICISFNHSAFLEDVLNSIWNLNYPNIQLIVADDASTDDSQTRIKELIKDKGCELVLNDRNIGHCKTFNKALRFAKGEFIIDLAADDILLPQSVAVAVEQLRIKGESYGVFFCDAELINGKGESVGTHFTKSFFKNKVVPEGDIYKTLLGKYFISPPTMVYRKTLLDKLNGYNEALSYEDFDFWVRSSRITNYCYSAEVTVQKRMLSTSVSTSQYVKNSSMLISTLAVCKTALRLNRNKSED